MTQMFCRAAVAAFALAGGAAVLAVVDAAARLGLPVAVTAVVPVLMM